ncbi:hypothetical protein FHX42_005205 [Saccharopolyspora lacisalsi]|uniref:Uncharacterized protein n=1 Tax=Halosaccharopolyspora lacisalsi TaxID=1000566 RepID=A0A839EAC9_9PSEU|nr:hypothetical protein [Halosaccharopolyspora lacisalsi]MBA8827798.1 hypothetical protein [Halosaccharopolyspora lacisalsi]
MVAFPNSPVPRRERLHQWVLELQARIESGECDGAAVVAELAEVRRASRDLGWLADWLLVAAREQGATLPPLAAAWSQSGSRLLVRGPDQRLKKLTDRLGDAAAVRDRFLALPAENTSAEPEERG